MQRTCRRLGIEVVAVASEADLGSGWLADADLVVPIGPARAPGGEFSFITVPTAHARFPAEIRPTPRAWAEQMYNIVRWTKLPKGGHFAAFEQPQPFLDDLRAFCRDFR